MESNPPIDVELAPAIELEELPSVVVARGSAWVLAGRIVGRGVALASGIVLARLLTPTELGDFYLAFSLATLAAAIGRLGMDTAATRFVAEALAEHRPGRARAVLRQTLVFSALGAGVIGAISALGGWTWLANNVFSNQRLAALTAAATILIVCMALQGTLVSWFRGLQVMRLVVLFDELVPGGLFLVLLVAVWLVSGNVGVTGALEIRAGGFALAILGVAVAMRPRLHTLRGTGHSPTRQVAGLGVTMMGAVLITAGVGSTSDLLILGAFRPAHEVAAYGVAVAVAAGLSMPYFAMTTALGPQLAQLNARGERGRMEDLIRGATSVVGFATLAATAVVVAFAHPLLTTLFGAAYGGASDVLIVLALAQAAFVLAGPCGLTLTMTGYHRAAFVLTLIAAIASVGADVWAAPRYGALGVAIASSSAFVLDIALTVFLTRRLVGVWTLPRFRRADLREARKVVRSAIGGRRVGWGGVERG